MKEKLTKTEKSWILYDVGNSAFVLMAATIFPIYFNSLAESAGMSSVDYLAFWGYAASAVTLVVAVIGPVFGTLSDTRGFKKPVFQTSVAVGSIGCAAMAFTHSWIAFLAVYMVAKIGYASSLVFYDAMLSDVTEEDRMDNVSSQGYAWGYIGSCIPFAVCLALVLCGDSIGIGTSSAMALAFLITAVWWIGCTLPLLKNFRQRCGVELKAHPFQESFGRLSHALQDVKENRRVLLFLIAFFFYIDGVYTIIDMATAYGSALGLDTTGLLLALLVTQIVAFPFALIFGWAAKKYENGKLIRLCIIAYTCVVLFAIQMDHQWEFWVLAVAIGMVQGGIQALSRSYFAKIIPPEKAGEFFGLFDICGKGASFIGTALVGITAQLTGSANAGVGALAVMFVIGFVLFGRSEKAAA